MNKRIDYIDIAKGIGILLVYIGHCNLNYKSPLFLWIYSFHMPLFFFISGFLYNTQTQPYYYDTIKKVVFKKVISLIIPYFFFSIIQSLLFMIFNIHLQNWLIKGWGTNPLWFLPILFSIEIIHTFILSKKKLLAFIGIFSLISLFLYKVTTNRWLPFCISEIPWFYICFLEGYLSKHILQKKALSTTFTIILFALHFILLFQLIIPYNGNYRLQDNDTLSYIYRIIIGYIGTISILGISQTINNLFSSKLLKWIGKNSLVILCTHIMYINILQKIGCNEYSFLLAWILIIPSIILYNKYISSKLSRLKTTTK